MSLRRRESGDRGLAPGGGNPKPRSWLALALAVSAAAAVGADASPTDPSLVQRGGAILAWGSPGPAPNNPCRRPSTVRRVEESRTKCGSPRGDVITAPSQMAVTVYGLAGGDTISAKGPVHIYGGPGQDRANVRDQRYASWGPDTEKVYDVNGRRLSRARVLQGPPTDFDPSKVPLTDVRPRPPSVKCGTYTNGNWFVRFAEEPLLRAFNAIQGKIEFQKVAFAAALYKWDAGPGRWVIHDRPVWFWDETHDRDWPTLDLDFWRTFDTLERTKANFRITSGEPGYYRAAVAYHWYAAAQTYQGQTVNVPTFDVEAKFVLDHFGLSNDKTGRYLKDRYCAFGVDPEAGP
jgi:hypothetical protein